MAKQTGTLFIIAAPSGAGKTTLVAELVKQVPRLTVSVSYTTRPQRSQEKDGVNYHFVDEATFLQMIERGEFLEYANVFNQHYYYGTLHKWVKDTLASGMDVIVEIDWQGAQQVRRLHPSAVGIFILPPSRDALATRLQQRQQDSDTVINQRLQVATDEMSHYAEFDYLMVNQTFDVAVAQLRAIVEAQRLTISRQSAAEAELLQALLA